MSTPITLNQVEKCALWYSQRSWSNGLAWTSTMAGPSPVTSYQMSTPLLRLTGIKASLHGLDHGGRVLVPDRIGGLEARDLHRMLVQRHAAELVEMIVVEEAAAGLQEPVHRLVAGGHRGEIFEIVDGDARDHEIERPADLLRPGWIEQV